MTIDELKAQRRWVLWRLEKRPGEDKDTKVPYQPNGHKASSVNPATWLTYAEVAAVSHLWSGVGCVMGEVDGIHVSGVDIDNCCDAVTGKFTPESREIVIGLDSYSEFSPSGTGCHVLLLGTLRGRKGLKEPFPGAKAVEVYDQGRYLTFTGRHLKKTPDDILEREDALNTLYDRVQAAKPKSRGITVTISVSEEERLKRLMAGDTSLHNDDPSAADFALCCLLAKKHGGNPVTIDDEFRKSKRYREKWERDDYRGNTIGRAIMAVAKETPIIDTLADADPLSDDSPVEFLVDIAEEDGWFPFREISVIGGPSGVGKTTWALLTLESIRAGEPVWGHPVKPRDYRVLMGDRSKASVRRTVKRMPRKDEVVERIIRLSTRESLADPAEVLDGYADQTPGVRVWFIEGLDMWFPDANKMQVVAPALDRLQRVAQRRNLCVVASVGSPKFKGDTKDRYYGRDGLFGSSAWARKTDTIVLLSLHDAKDANSTRVCWVLPRDAKAEQHFFTWANGRFVECDKPSEANEEEQTGNFHKILAVARQLFGPEEALTYTASLGCSRATYFRWLPWAKERDAIHKADKRWYLTRPVGGAEVSET